MQLRALFLAALCAAPALPLNAQIRDVPVRTAPRMWAGVWGGMYTTVDNIYDPGTDSNWAFGDPAIAFGVQLEREISQGLVLGLEGSYGQSDFERRDSLGVVAASGDANLLSAFLTGRLMSGGAGGLGAYLKGGLGTFGYKTPDPDKTSFDFALTSGAGVEYRFRPRFAVMLEWTKLWAYHEKEGLDDSNTGRHSLLRGGVRFGF